MSEKECNAVFESGEAASGKLQKADARIASQTRMKTARADRIRKEHTHKVRKDTRE
jgi:hypothetical protein